MTTKKGGQGEEKPGKKAVGKAATPAPKRATPAAKKAPATKRPPAKAAVKAPAPVPARKRAPAKKVPAGSEKAAKAPEAIDEDAVKPLDHELMGLTLREARFVDLYLLSFNASRSYVEAGFSAKPGPSAEACSSRLLGTAKVQAFLRVRAKAMFDRMGEEQDKLIRSYTYTAYADPRELSEYRRGACRYCYGKFHRYQFTAGEWDRKMTEYAERQEKADEDGRPMPKEPDAKGGTGYDWRKPPYDDCPECFGLGEGRNIVKDTANLSPAALALFAGVKEGRDGIEVKMHDQMAARGVLAKYRKLYEDGANVNVQLVASAELDAIYSAGVAGAQSGKERVMGRGERLRKDLGDGA